jgi:hypothetical protein
LRDGSNSDANIENRFGMPAQLFNSFDPSLFHERNPDEDAEAYEFPLQTPAGFHLPADQLPSAARVRRCEHGIGTWCFSARSEF